MNPNRRTVLQAGIAGLIATLPACASRNGAAAPLLGFTAVPISTVDNVVVPPPYAKLGNNQMLAADVSTGEIRRFLTGPKGAEITGVTAAPDGRSLFVNIQHPGEPASERSEGRPRAATLVIPARGWRTRWDLRGDA